VEVQHFPWRSWAQFERKVIASGRAYESNATLLPSPNHHGMKEYSRYKLGSLFAAYITRHPDLMRDPARHPHRALGRHGPAPLACGDEHGAVRGEDELGALVAMRRDVMAGGEVLGHGGHGAGHPLVVGGVGRSEARPGCQSHVRFSTIFGPL